MEDRWNRLAVEAYLRGAIDFRQFHRYDDLWRLKEDLIFRTLESDLAAKLNKLVLQWHCSAAQLTEWDEKAEQFEFHKGKAEETYNDIGKHYMPWLNRWNQSEGERLAKLYRAFKEEEKKPEFRSWHDAIQSRMRGISREMTMQAEQAKMSQGRKDSRDKEQQALLKRRRERKKHG